MSTLIAQLLHAALKLLAEGGRQHTGPVAIGIADRQVEDFGLTKLGATRRPHVDVVAEAFDIQFARPLGSLTIIARRADFTQRGLHHALALGKLQNGFLQRLHFRQIGELAQPLFRNARGFGPNDKSLCRTPFTRRDQAVSTGQDRKHDGRYRPPTIWVRSRRTKSAGCSATPEFECVELS